MNELSEATKLEIVIRLAQFATPTEIVADLATEGIATEVRRVGSYDPTRSYYEAGDKWRPIFDEARKAYIEDLASIPMVSQAFRVNELTDLYRRAKKMRDYKLASDIAEQISKEVGGVFTNQREVSLKDGRARARDLSSDERKEALFAIIDEAMAKRPTDQGTASVQ